MLVDAPRSTRSAASVIGLFSYSAASPLRGSVADILARIQIQHGVDLKSRHISGLFYCLCGRVCSCQDSTGNSDFF